MSRFGVTASRAGPTLAQMNKLTKMMAAIIELGPLFESTDPGKPWLHHGDCVGGDEFAHDLARVLGFRIQIHPPTDPKQRAFCKGADLVKPERPYLDRNKDIVNVVGRMWVMPETFEEKLRSGTWSTYRYAKATGRRFDIIFPDGSTRSG